MYIPRDRVCWLYYIYNNTRGHDISHRIDVTLAHMKRARALYASTRQQPSASGRGEGGRRERFAARPWPWHWPSASRRYAVASKRALVGRARGLYCEERSRHRCNPPAAVRWWWWPLRTTRARIYETQNRPHHLCSLSLSTPLTFQLDYPPPPLLLGKICVFTRMCRARKNSFTLLPIIICM